MNTSDATNSSSPAESANPQSPQRKVTGASRLTELYLWTIAALIVGGRLLFVVMTSAPYEAPMIIREYYWDFAITALVLFFPVIFKLIFGALPLEYLRTQRAQATSLNLEGSISPTIHINAPSEAPKQADTTQVGDELRMLHAYANSSRQLAKGIYGRAGVYLLVGVLVAFSGLVFFYAQTPSIAGETSLYSLLVILAPKFGILFFIEFVAFFFLRQYRSAMDEFRYYDGVARVREEVLALLHVSSNSGKQIPLMDLVRYDAYFSRAGLLSKGQSTEIIEARRLEGSELELVQKALEAVTKARK